MVLDELHRLQEEGQLTPSHIAKDVAERSGWPRRTVYDFLMDLD
jgi:hypothetical protein